MHGDWFKSMHQWQNEHVPGVPMAIQISKLESMYQLNIGTYLKDFVDPFMTPLKGNLDIM